MNIASLIWSQLCKNNVPAKLIRRNKVLTPFLAKKELSTIESKHCGFVVGLTQKNQRVRVYVSCVIVLSVYGIVLYCSAADKCNRDQIRLVWTAGKYTFMPSHLENQE